VGIGCGAGWATQYKGCPACLLGLENLAECKWHTKKKLQGLLAHELGHLAHMKKREEWKTFEKNEEDPFFQLYSEGFAQRYGHVILGKQIWHQAQDEEWIPWCELNKGWLAKEFLERTEKRKSIGDFFGSWFEIQGKRETGYFLGYMFIRHLEKTYSLGEIALLSPEKIRKLAVNYLESISSVHKL
jgi:hypothetical protein